MGEYKAMFSLPKHPFGTVQNLDDNDPVVMQRVKSGMLVPVLKPGSITQVWADNPQVDVESSEAKPEPKKRATRKKPEVEVEADEPNPQVEVEGSATPVGDSQPDTMTVEAPSSVMTSWNLSD
jgi:hypothetical protein